MDTETFEIIHLILTSGKGSISNRLTGFDDVSRAQIENKFFDKEVKPPTKCLQLDCSATVTVERTESQLEIVCDMPDEPHEYTEPIEKHTYFSVNFEPVLEEICNHIDFTLDHNSFSSDQLPKYALGYSDDGLKVVLLVSPADLSIAVTKVYSEALRDDQPTLLITPEDKIEKLLDLQSIFSTGSLVYTAPFSFLDEEPKYISGPVNTLLDIHDLEQTVLSEELSGENHEIISRVNSNPRYVLAELNHMRLLRKNKELPQSSGARLESVAEVGFAQLFPTKLGKGGENDRGKPLPDHLFYIPENKGRPSESILGVVDSKSGDTAKLGKEEAKGKHDEYLERANRPQINADWVAHTFLILDFEGQAEIEFFDKMDGHYSNNQYMLIITAQALATILSAYLATVTSNNIQLISGDFLDAIYPLFHPKEFKKQNLSTISRNVKRDSDAYSEEYLQRDRLLVVTKDVVISHLQNCVESPKDLDDIFELYMTPLPIV